MRVVVDASAVAAVLFQEPEGATIAAHCEGEALLAPHLLDYELANVVRTRIRKHPDDELAVRIISHGLGALNIQRLAAPPAEVVQLALHTGLTAYDAAYLWLALDRDAELLTLDRELATADRVLRGEPG